MDLDEARGIAARCWCEKETEHFVMMPELAEAFAWQLIKAHEEAYKAGQEDMKEKAAGVADEDDTDCTNADHHCGCSAGYYIAQVIKKL